MFKKLTTTAILLAAMPFATVADTAFPDRPIRFVVPFTAGGITDNVARTVGAKAAEILDQVIIVENRPGAGGNIGAESVARSKADGYTVFLGTQGTQVTNPLLYKSVRYNPEKDFIAVQGLTAIPNIVVVNESRPYTTLKALVDYAKDKPGVLTNSSAGVGTGTHLAAELFQSVVGVQFRHIPYKGSAPSITDLIGGVVDLSFDYPVSTEPHIKSGKLRALAVTGEARTPSLPDVPTLAELGYPGATSVSWMGVFVPTGTPDSVVKKLEAAFSKAINDPQVSAKLADFGGVPLQKTGPEFTEFVKQETVKWTNVVKKSGVTLD